MNRGTSMVVVLALCACGSEPILRNDLPAEQAGEPRPVESETHTDLITQTVNPSVDILYVVDNSCSMANDQDDLADNFPSFMQHFLNSGLDYHIGVVSSDVRDPQHSGKLQGGLGEKFITSEQNNQVNRFTAMAVLGNSGASPEKGLAGMWLSKNEDAAIRHNEGFFRDESALHTICVSDERDYSDGAEIGGGINEFIAWYDGLKRSADERSFSAIEARASGASGPGGKAYGVVTQVIGGVVWDIQVDDWSPALDVLGLRATGLKTEYFLSRAPVVDSIVVAIRTPIDQEYEAVVEYPRAEWDGERWVDGDWYYTEGRNSVTFLDLVPEQLSQVAITYTVASSVVSEQL